MLAGRVGHIDEADRAPALLDLVAHLRNHLLDVREVLTVARDGDAQLGKLAGLVQTVPLAVSGGLAIYLFGVIGMQGIALMQEHKVSMFDPRNLAVGAVIMIVGIGGNIGYPGGFIPVNIPGIFPNGLPAIATAAVLFLFILAINSIFLIVKRRTNN